MKAKLYIKNHISIRNSSIYRNANLLYDADPQEKLSGFLKSVYKANKLKYPKFYKMDMLSRLGYLGVELLTQGEITDKETALVFANSASSLDTDEAFAETMDKFPSPSLFVYTLPNIMLGEISIRHQLRSENIFFVSERFDASLFIDYCQGLFQHDNTENALCGWVDLHNNDYDVFLWEIARSGRLELNEEELKKIYLPTHE